MRVDLKSLLEPHPSIRFPLRFNLLRLRPELAEGWQAKVEKLVKEMLKD